MTSSLVFDIVRGSDVDGPGLRTTVFLKGCPLRCVWCQNPEGQSFHPKISHSSERCIRCGTCAAACPHRAIDLGAERIDDVSAQLLIRRERCDTCQAFGACANACDSLALRDVGVEHSVDELVELILRDRVFFEVSGGGVTFSGGEPLVHMSFLGPVARRLHHEGIHVAIETCGQFAYGIFGREVLPWVDLVLFDVKLADSAAHERYTGAGNERILENLGRLVGENDLTVLPRIPLVPGITATRENLAAIVELLGSLGVAEYELLPYNPSGLAKWRQLGASPPENVPLEPLPLEEQLRLKAFLAV